MKLSQSDDTYEWQKHHFNKMLSQDSNRIQERVEKHFGNEEFDSMGTTADSIIMPE